MDEREAEPEGQSALARTLRERLEEERRRSEEAEAQLDRQRAAAAGLGAALSRAEASLAAKKAFWEVRDDDKGRRLAFAGSLCCSESSLHIAVVPALAPLSRQ